MYLCSVYSFNTLQNGRAWRKRQGNTAVARVERCRSFRPSCTFVFLPLPKRLLFRNHFVCVEARGLEHPLDSGAILTKRPNSTLFPLQLGSGDMDGPSEMLKFKMSTPPPPLWATPDYAHVCESLRLTVLSVDV